MDVIEKLIKSLQEAKAELEKNMNCAPGSNMDKAEDEPHKDDPDHEKKEKKAASKIKEEAEDILDLHKDEDLDKNNRNRGKQAEQQRGYSFSQIMEGKRHSDEMERQSKANAVAPVKSVPVKDYKPQVKLLKEELTCSANGQWNLNKDAANPELAPKDKKVKMLQAQVDAGTYKPDAGKIAGAMIEHAKKK